MTTPTAELARLLSGYNNGNYNAGSNPLGFSNGGHRVNLYALTADMVVVTQWAVDTVAPIVDMAEQIEALAAISAQVVAVANLEDEIEAVAALSVAISGLYTIRAAIVAVDGNAANINAAVANQANINSVATNMTAILAVEGQAATASSASAAAIAALDSALSLYSNIEAINNAVSTATTQAGIASNKADEAAASAFALDAAVEAYTVDPATLSPVLPTLDLIFNSSSAIQSSWFTRASTATYFDANWVMRTAANNELRIDHDPVTGDCRGALVEAAGTNLSIFSEQFDNAAWALSLALVTANATLAPDGSSTADKFYADGVSASGRVISQNVTVTVAQLLTFSIFMKMGECRYAVLTTRNVASAANQVNVEFDLQNGVISRAPIIGGAGASPSAAIQSVGNGWFRCSLTGIADTSGTSVSVRVGIRDATNNNSAADGNGAFIWGAQLETGSAPTSYIPTTSAQVTRAADQLTMAGTDVAATTNLTEGSIYIEGTAPNASFLGGLWQIDDVTGNNRITIARLASGAIEMTAAVSGTIQALFSAGVVANGAKFKIAAAWKANDFAVSVDGAVVATDTSGTIPSALSRERIGVGAAGYANCPISRHMRTPRRLPNATLQAMSA